MKSRIQSKDADIRASFAALKRAARRARELALATGTPLIVERDGRIVDLNAGARKRPARKRPAKLG